jgi:hypothetical protein
MASRAAQSATEARRAGTNREGAADLVRNLGGSSLFMDLQVMGIFAATARAVNGNAIFPSMGIEAPTLVTLQPLRCDRSRFFNFFSLSRYELARTGAATHYHWKSKFDELRHSQRLPAAAP